MDGDSNFKLGTEHAVELSIASQLVGKTTIPPAFGLVPQVISLPRVDLRAEPGVVLTREVIEFLNATPLEYLARWLANNEVFGDDVRLASVIAWPDGRISFDVIPCEPDEALDRFLRIY